MVVIIIDISKIENQESVENIDRILNVSDGIMSSQRGFRGGNTCRRRSTGAKRVLSKM